MADYEVRVVPTLEVDTEQLQGQIKELGKTISKSSGRIRIQADIDTKDLNNQIRAAANEAQVIEIDTQVNPRSAAEVEKEIRSRIKKIEQLSDVQQDFDFGIKKDRRDLQAFNEVADAISLMEAELQKLITLRDEWRRLDKGETTLRHSERTELNMLESTIESIRESASDLQEEFFKLHKSVLELPKAEIPVGLDEARITESARTVLSNVQDNLGDASVNVDVVVSEAAMRDMEQSIESLQRKFDTLEGIVANTQIAIDTQPVMPTEETPVDTKRQAENILDLYNQQASAISGILSDIGNMDEATRSLLQTNSDLLISFQALQGKVLYIENGTQQFKSLLAAIDKDVAIDPVSRDLTLPVDMTPDDVLIQESMRRIAGMAQDAVNEQPVNLAVQISDTNFEEILQTILQ